MLKQLKQKVLKEITQAKDLKSLDKVYRKYLGRQGELTKVLRSLKDLPAKERKEKGQLANQLKKEIAEIIKERTAKFSAKRTVDQSAEWIDVTAPGILPSQGHLHPISLVQEQIEEIFQSMGFSVVEGPEIETEYYNFDALNIPQDHPARDLWDTFWLKDVIAGRSGEDSSLRSERATQSRGKSDEIASPPAAARNDGLLLRTHTSPMQVRYMEKHQPPLRIIVPGRCFRHEATDVSHDVQFYQTEGLMVGRDISMAHFKGVIEEFLKQFFGPEVKMRLRPGYFPFTEPSFEVDIKRKSPASAKTSAGKPDWLEIMGAGMVHPSVFRAVGYSPGKWQGFAFGVGLERLAMLKYQVDDIRLFYSGGLRFLKQF